MRRTVAVVHDAGKETTRGMHTFGALDATVAQVALAPNVVLAVDAQNGLVEEAYLKLMLLFVVRAVRLKVGEQRLDCVVGWVSQCLVEDVLIRVVGVNVARVIVVHHCNLFFYGKKYVLKVQKIHYNLMLFYFWK